MAARNSWSFSPHATPDLAWTIAERIRSSVEALAIVNPGIDPADGAAGVVTISLGVAFAQEDAAPEIVAKWADDALYDAKRGGRNIVFLSNAHCRRGRASRAACRHAARGTRCRVAKRLPAAPTNYLM